MKKTFNLSYEDKKYFLKNTNPNDNREPFMIDEETLEFDTNKFYTYVFSEVNGTCEIQISCEGIDVSGGLHKRVYETIREICNGVIDEMNKMIFS